MHDYTAWAAHPYLRSPTRSLLPDSVRREVAELNRQFLAAIVADDQLFRPECWRGAEGAELQAPALLDALAACPFTLFELRLEATLAAAPDPDEPRTLESARRAALRAALAQSALTLAWRLADSSPLSMRLALGFSPAAELVINEIRVTSLPDWARRPGLLGTRWIGHVSFWSALLGAARAGEGAHLARVHCLGITLLVGELGAHPRDGEARSASGARSRR
jgi:hypothetical protein